MLLPRFAFGVALIALAVHTPSIGQSPQELAIAAGAPAPPPGWTVPRTEWGDPDLRGTWPLGGRRADVRRDAQQLERAAIR